MTYADSLFDAFMYPLEAVSLAARRRERIPRACGDVLELGSGTGSNLAYYHPGRITTLTLSDLTLSERLKERAREYRRSSGLSESAVRLAAADASGLCHDDATFDTVVFTLVFCSVPNQEIALSEVHRVLRPGGTVVFIEHVRPHGPVGHLVDRANFVWHAVTRECNIDRDTAGAMLRAGFRFRELRVSGGGFLIDGVAEKTTGG